MPSEPDVEPAEGDARFLAQVGAQTRRKLRAQTRRDNVVWFGLGMMGLVGWSIVAPTLLGVALGVWLDEHVPGKQSWTLTLLLAGLFLGCLNAWRWVAKEERALTEEERDSHG